MTITAQELVRREVIYCVSGLVHTLANSGNELQERAQELCYSLEDYDEAADYETSKWSREDCVTYLESLSIECRDDEPIEVLREAVIVNAREEGIEDFCQEHDIEPYEREIYEHWIVSDWLAEKLAAKGERVDTDFAGMTVWGRTTTGQAIYMDSVIQEIHAELVKPYKE